MHLLPGLELAQRLASRGHRAPPARRGATGRGRERRACLGMERAEARGGTARCRLALRRGRREGEEGGAMLGATGQHCGLPAGAMLGADCRSRLWRLGIWEWREGEE